MESILKQESRRKESTSGWIETYLGLKTDEESTVLESYRDDMNLDATWTFPNDLKGENKLSKFTDSLSVVHTMDEDVEDAKAWLKPVWALRPKELVSSLFISDNQYWAICSSPVEVGNERISNKIKRFFSPKGPKRHAFATDHVSYGCTAGGSDNWFVKQN